MLIFTLQIPDDFVDYTETETATKEKEERPKKKVCCSLISEFCHRTEQSDFKLRVAMVSEESGRSNKFSRSGNFVKICHVKFWISGITTECRVRCRIETILFSGSFGSAVNKK